MMHNKHKLHVTVKFLPRLCYRHRMGDSSLIDGMIAMLQSAQHCGCAAMLVLETINGVLNTTFRCIEGSPNTNTKTPTSPSIKKKKRQSQASLLHSKKRLIEFKEKRERAKEGMKKGGKIKVSSPSTLPLYPTLPPTHLRV